jgi:hypothetical protein
MSPLRWGILGNDSVEALLVLKAGAVKAEAPEAKMRKAPVIFMFAG